MEKYYWLDTDYFYGNFFEPKWALVCGQLDEDGEKDRDTEEVVVWGAWPDADEWNDWNSGDGVLGLEKVDEAIFTELGFLPDYDIN